jgi:hypothetical protein
MTCKMNDVDPQAWDGLTSSPALPITPPQSSTNYFRGVEGEKLSQPGSLITPRP